ncbi:unnamed protein product [Spodoptera exigua]|nr:unnamed protein product [Spodoptera exigua]
MIFIMRGLMHWRYLRRILDIFKQLYILIKMISILFFCIKNILVLTFLSIFLRYLSSIEHDI